MKKVYYLLIVIFVLIIEIKYYDIRTISDLKSQTLKVIDDLNPFVGRSFTEYDNLPTFNLILKSKDFKKLDDILKQTKKDANIYHPMPYLSNFNNGFIKIKLFFNGEKYKAKLRFHGTDFPHFIKNKKSYFIKLYKNKLINNMRRFSFIVLEQDSIATIFANKLLEKYMNFKINTFLCRMKINGVDQGIYLLEEKLHKTLLERNNLSGIDIIKAFDEWDYQYRRNGAINPFYRIAANQKFKNISRRETGQLIMYEYLFSDANISDIKKIIDEDKFAKVEALRVLFGDEHQVSGENFKLLYSSSMGKFLPFFRNEDVLKKIKLDKNSAIFENSLYPKDNLFLRRLIRNNEFRNKRNKFLYQLIKDKKEILEIFENIKSRNLPIILTDSTNNYSTFRYKNIIKSKEEALKNNFKEIEAYLKYNKVYLEMDKLNSKKYLLKIIPDSNSPLKVKDFVINTNAKKIKIEDKQTGVIEDINISNIKKFFKNKSFQLSLDSNLQIRPSIYEYLIYNDNNFLIKDYNITFTNRVTNLDVNKRSIRKILNNVIVSFKYLNENIDDFIHRYKDLNFTKIDRYNILLNSGDYIIKENIVLPYGIDLTIEKGTNIKIAPKKSLIVHSALNIKGTERNPVTISNLNKNQPFGVIGAIGDGNKNCIIEYLNLYGGKDTVINGSYLSGALSIYNHNKVIIKYSHIHHNSADDGLNIKNSEVEIIKNIFNANKADQVDLDFCKGYIKYNKFLKKSLIKKFNAVSILIDDNGDGLDFSGSNMIVQNNSYKGFLDKGISIGENTKAFISNNSFLQNRSAITIKDQSKVFIYKNYYKDNKINLEIYQKKKIFGYPSVYNLNDDLKKKIKKIKKAHYYKSNEKIILHNIDLNIFEKLKNKRWIEYE